MHSSSASFAVGLNCPVSMELTGKRGTWTSEDFEILADGIRHGDSYAAIGKAVGRSEKCVRSKVYNDYLTENAG